jgi:uncharacterized protein (DUF697 family)/predicted GTPase
MAEGFWRSLSEAIFAPKINQDELETKLRQIRNLLPTPVFWLLGKAQSGKTSIIRALTKREDVEIGDGFQACTHSSHIYDFPSSTQPMIRFLDTRGLGEVDYDPDEDLKLFQQQAHVLIVVMKALDHAQLNVVTALHAILKHRPNYPVIVVQTHLHEGYPNLDTEHIQPYAYAQNPLPPDVPKALAKSLLKQRELFKGINAQFIPVDFTLPNDGYDPPNYGLEVLWEEIEKVLPMGLRGMLVDSGQRSVFKNIYARTAHPHIIAYAVLAGGAGAIPIPFVGTPIVLSIQAKMFHTVASIYNQRLNSQRVAEIGSTLGLGFVLGMGGREVTKFVPLYGSVVSSAYTAAVTYALGKTLCAYFSFALDGDLPDEIVFEKIYEEELKRGRELMSYYLQKIRKE